MVLVPVVFKQMQPALEEVVLPTEWLQKGAIYLEQLALLNHLPSSEAHNSALHLKLLNRVFSNLDQFLNSVALEVQARSLEEVLEVLLLMIPTLTLL